jgi:hypothetical protein
MRFSIFAVVGLASSVIAAPVVSEDGKSIIAALNGIKAAMTTFDGLIAGYTGADKAKKDAILKQDGAIQAAIKAATAAAKASSKLNTDDSVSVTVAALALLPQQKSTLKDLANKKPAFAKAGDVGLVHKQLTTEKELSDTLNTEITKKLADFVASQSSLLSTQIDGAFNDAITAFKS